MECVLVADDLTGACDAAVHFAAGGWRVRVPLDPEAAAGEADVLAFSTASRDVDAAEAVCRIRLLAGSAQALEPRILYKKIDSTLRGNTAVEIVAAVEAFGCDAAVVNPAFPAMGRVVHEGRLAVPRDPGLQPIELAAWLRAHGADPCAHVGATGIAASIVAGARFITTDAACDEDLDVLAAEGLACGGRILWVGSGGLAAALARHVARACGGTAITAAHGPVWFCIGSDHPVTVEQRRRLMEHPGRHAVAQIPRGGPMPKLPDCGPAALFLCGGDTASAVCTALGARWIELRREFAPGIPEGMLRGGVLDGIPVLTKSGGFGAPDDLIRIAEHYDG